MLNPQGKLPLEPGSDKPLEFGRERAEALVVDVQKSRRKIILPAPAIAELLTAIGPDAQQYINIVSRFRVFEVGAFDTRVAAELAVLNRGVFVTFDLKNGLDTYQKRKVDRQIVAICKFYGATELYTDDVALGTRCKLAGITPMSLFDVAIPDSARQGAFDLVPHDDIPAMEIAAVGRTNPV